MTSKEKSDSRDPKDMTEEERKKEEARIKEIEELILGTEDNPRTDIWGTY